MMFVTLLRLSPYVVCRLNTFVAYDVCRLMRFVAYDVCRLIKFVAYDVCRLMRFAAYNVLWCVVYDVCCSAPLKGQCHEKSC